MTKHGQPTSVELFTGAGGLALGVAKAGYRHEAVIEWNEDACDSLRGNAHRVSLMRDWPVFQQDVRDYDFSRHEGVDALAAGAPCQPFSLGGKHRGDQDHRNMFPAVFGAVLAGKPKAVIVENVKGLLRQSFRPYFEYILLAIRFPELVRKATEDWTDHKARLERADRRPQPAGLRYVVAPVLLNAADYGVPQRRERVFVLAIREDLGVELPRFTPTHSEELLMFDKWVTGDYWAAHDLKRRRAPAELAARIEHLRSVERGLLVGERWRTVRDALRGLPEPKDRKEDATFANHVGNPGARTYPGHTGSPFDEPAKTLKAGDHGVPGGENILRRENGSVRYFTVREAARLQCFPDEYVFSGAWTEGFRQLGNAVPVDLAHVVASRMREAVESRSAKARVA